MTAVSIYHIEHRLKQKHLLPYHEINKLKEIDINNILYKMESNDKLKEISIKNGTCYNLRNSLRHSAIAEALPREICIFSNVSWQIIAEAKSS